MRDLWPPDIKAEDVITPEEILVHQAQLLEARTNGLLVGHVEKLTGEDRVILGFEVESPRTGSRHRLFQVQHRPEFEYPVSIDPPDESLPDFLKARVYKPGFRDVVATTAGGWVENKWVASSPTEFSARVEEVLARPAVKAAVLSLISRANREETANGGMQGDKPD
jgi:hypothetical protein